MKLMKEDEQSPLFRRPGDGGSEENCSRPVLGGGGESNFKRTSLRSTLHGEWEIEMLVLEVHGI